MELRPYRPEDEASWLECRLLAFFRSSYYDDVHTAKDRFPGEAIELVVVDDGRVLGLIDVTVDGADATIDSIAVLPAAQRAGVATRLLERTVERLPAQVKRLDAWTREDPAANAWYLAHGFAVDHRYLHVYLQEGDPEDGFRTPEGMSLPVKAFMHAPLEQAAALRGRFARVHECRRYLRKLS